MPQLSDSQIEQLLANAGFPASAIPTFVAIAHAESGGNSDALNPTNNDGSQDIGLFQINSYGGFDNSRLYDPVYNAQAAYSLFSRRGTEPWNSSKSRWGNAVTTPTAKKPENWWEKIGGNFITNPKKYFTQDVPNGVNQVKKTVSDPLGLGGLTGGLASWFGEGVKYAALFIMGLMFLILGFVIIFRKPIGDVASKVPVV
jgi:hypothetical protein